jgi:hypothetical protein
MYDYYLGGAHNFEVDRIQAEKAIAIYRDFPKIMRANRAFLRRVVSFLAREGVDQFLDLGSGIPTVGNVHETAQHINPTARILYVDIDPIAVAQSASLLRNNPYASAIQGDLREPEIILNHEETRQLLNFQRPVAVILAFVLHFIPDDNQVDHIVRVFRAALVPRSYLVISHSSGDGTKDAHDALISLYRQSNILIKPRRHSYFERWFAGLEIVDPGIVYTPQWRPESADDLYLNDPQSASGIAAVGRIPTAL